jgi:nicotinate-nucleotide adenylyltransferase
MARTRLGILGGTFDPIHLGHLVPAQYAWNQLGLARLLLVPSAQPVHRPEHEPAPAAHRFRMCELAARNLPGFEACDIEMRRAEPSYTILTLQALAEQAAAGTELVLLVGSDNLPQLGSWHRIRDILRLATLAVLPRAGTPPDAETRLVHDLGPVAAEAILANTVDSPLVPVSATDLRGRLAAGRSVQGLVPAAIAAYIAERRLYERPDPARA